MIGNLWNRYSQEIQCNPNLKTLDYLGNYYCLGLLFPFDTTLSFTCAKDIFGGNFSSKNTF